MLILTRSKGQAVDLKDERTGEVVARVVVCEILHDSIRLGFDAPRHISVLRDNAKQRTQPQDPPADTDGHG